ncbi:MAG TPA: hypothetical protein VKT33_06260 [Candidatus Angelobacter sp.]|nr:hypothetical protein [Candidatus Angelobacter sp.]
MPGAAAAVLPAPATVIGSPRTSLQWGFPEFFIISQILAPAVLFLPGTQSLRVLIRMAPFLISLGPLVFYGRKVLHFKLMAPAQKWLVLCCVWLVLMVFHPGTNSITAAAAQAMLYLSVMAPIFWAPHIKLTPERMQRLLFIILIVSGINSMVGILQVYDPGTWMPKELSVRVTGTLGGVENVSYIGPDGRVIIRPTGLSDNPGAVSGPATAAALLGLIFFFEPIRLWRRLVAAFSALAGVTVIFLSQVRTSLLVACGALLAYVLLLALQRQKRKALLLVIFGVLAFVVSFFFAVGLGGQSIENRFATLFADNPTNVYYENRGAQIQYGVDTLLFQYPAGAGIGRWGMMYAYFGDPNNLESPALWAELQPNAWVLDGGLVLLLLYSFAVLANLRSQIRMVRAARSQGMKFSTSAIAAVNLVTMALIFGYTPFTNQVGVQYWFLSGSLHSMPPDYKA